MRHYSDFFTVADDYCPVMTREEINKTPDRWLDFYPHTEFEDICKTLLSVLGTGAKSVWITGNYGTGKSNAALVIQKLFMDDEARVVQWLNEHAENGLSDHDSLKKNLFARRAEGTLVVYDFNASGVGADDGLLVRLEKGIIAALEERGLSVPAMSNLDMVIERVRREGANFFKTRDSIQSHLAYLDSSIKNADQLAASLNNTATSSKLLDDVEAVLHKDFIYLDFDVPMFRNWIKAILVANNLQRIVYIFDEFHPFIEANKEQLKTFEDVTETPGVNRFFLVPVTHMEINAYMAEGSDSARKANDRFYFRKLQMPNDTAFRLAKHAMVDVRDSDLAAEWKKAKGDLWDSVSSLVNKFNGTDDPGRDRFYDILPIHPMAAFLLKHLSEQAKSNQRSFFEYLKGGEDGMEFQDFIRAGGPEVANKQFLTVDYLWHYFIDRNDLGLDHAKNESLVILRSKLSDVILDDSDLLRVLNEMVGGFGLDENTFLTNIRIKIEEFAKNSVVMNIKGEWVRISGVETPARWAMNNNVPARYIFRGIFGSSDLLKAIEHPETFSATRLAEILEALKTVKAASIFDCQQALMSEVIPARYRKFNMSLASLIDFLKSKHGNQPNFWPARPDISEFIKNQYKGAIAPHIVEKINVSDAEELKARLLQLAKENPELGLLFWEG